MILASDCVRLGLLVKMSLRKRSPLTSTSSTTYSPEKSLLPRHLSTLEPISASPPMDKKGTCISKVRIYQGG